MATYDIDSLPSSFQNGDIINCPYKSGVEKQITLPKGTFKFECWGARGGYPSGYKPAYGGYSYGEITLSSSQLYYLNVGGAGAMTNIGSASGGHNGGGSAYSVGITLVSYESGSGGGATHIATRSGLLANLSNYKSSVVIVAGGGGGRMGFASSDQLTYDGAGGGVSGSDGTDLINGSPRVSNTRHARGGSQTSGGQSGSLKIYTTIVSSMTSTGSAGSFGKGGNSDQQTIGTAKYGGAGGGGGYYGGGGGAAGWSGYPSVCGYAETAGGGSGYIGNLSNSGTSSYPNNLPDGGDNGYIRITVLSIEQTNGIFIKENGSWKEYSSVFKKVNGSWVLQSKSSSVIDPNKTLTKGS